MAHCVAMKKGRLEKLGDGDVVMEDRPPIDYPVITRM